jgi:hypothetical protein
MRLHPLTDHHPDIVPQGAIILPCKLSAIDSLVAKYVDPSRLPELKRLSRDWLDYLESVMSGDHQQAEFHASFMVAE